MIVFDLICNDAGHQFEGWFSSTTDFEEQQKSGLIDCPVCGCTEVKKALMAPNVGSKSNQSSGAPRQVVSEQRTPAPAVSNGPELTAEMKQLVTKVAEAQAKLLEKSEWVGDKFADQARDMHYGDEEEKPIHGTATAEEAQDLADEGIAVAPLPLPIVPPESKN